MRSRTTAAVTAVLAASMVVAGCTSDPEDTTTPTGSASAGPSTSAADPSSAGPVQNPLPSSVGNDVDKRKSVALAECKAVDGGWSASGTATNTGDSDATYTITVFFTTDKATVQDFATTKVTVAAGASKMWAATKKFAASLSTLCVLRGVA